MKEEPCEHICSPHVSEYATYRANIKFKVATSPGCSRRNLVKTVTMVDALMPRPSKTYFAQTFSFIMESEGGRNIEGNIDRGGDEENEKVDNNDMKENQSNIKGNEDDVKVHNDDFMKGMEENCETKEKLENSNSNKDTRNDVNDISNIYEVNDRIKNAEANDDKVYPTSLQREIKMIMTGKSKLFLDLSNRDAEREKTTNNTLAMSPEHWRKDEMRNKLCVHSSSMQSSLTKEMSTLGELIRDEEVKRDSKTCLEGYGRLSKNESLNLKQKLTRCDSITRKPCLKRIEFDTFSNKVTVSRKKSYPGDCSQDKLDSASKVRLSRRQTMLNALRDDTKLASLPAPRRNNTMRNIDSDGSLLNTGLVVIDKEVGDHWSKKGTHFIKQKGVAARMDSRRDSSISSPELYEPVFMEEEIKKLRMMETLNLMGQKHQRRLSRKDSSSRLFGKMTAMEESLNQRRKARISTTVLTGAQKKQKKSKTQTAISTSFDLSKAEKKEIKTPNDISEDERGRVISVLNNMKKVEKRQRASIDEETGNESINTFRRRSRRKKVRMIFYKM
ncbi:hypothetical protein CHS0354_016112 [Potamilus streckersoni]|uniref:Uncharacterized protein n=1 Tax=Potamilus streckersoni TaxID=2493646 RepID=A0AAE0T119_9BIVA|nr:hypothetical protein CHS0354_016112 [Potamilus streckersoni]